MYGWALLHFVLCVSTFHFHSDLYLKWLVLIHLFFSASGPEKVSFEQGGVLLTGKWHLCLWLHLFSVCVFAAVSGRCFHGIALSLEHCEQSLHDLLDTVPSELQWPEELSVVTGGTGAVGAAPGWSWPLSLLLTWAGAVCSPHPWAAAQSACSMGTPADFSEPTWKSGLAFLWSLSSGLCLCYSHLHVHEHPTPFPSSSDCFMSYNWKFDLEISWMVM